MPSKRRFAWLGMSILASVLMLMLGLWVLPERVSSEQASRSTEVIAQLQATDTFTAFLPIVLKPPSPPPEDWLGAVNYYRALANLPPVTENATYSTGDWYHARYMVKNDYLGHDEDSANPWYTPEGAQAAASSNLMVSSDVNATDLEAINTWVQAPFHGIGMIDPALHEVGFGSYRESIGWYRMGAALDVIRGLGSISPTITFPIYFPSDGKYMPVLEHWGEYPDPLSSCPGYTAPSGSPIILQIGSGGQTPNVTSSSLLENGVACEHCVFDETNYTNPDSSAQSLGRSILNSRDAIVIMPREPLVSGARYTVSITVNGTEYTWSFTALDPSEMSASVLPSFFQIGTPAQLSVPRTRSSQN